MDLRRYKLGVLLVEKNGENGGIFGWGVKKVDKMDFEMMKLLIWVSVTSHEKKKVDWNSHLLYHLLQLKYDLYRKLFEKELQLLFDDLQVGLALPQFPC